MADAGTTPYGSQPDRAFWRRAVSGKVVADLSELFDTLPQFRQAKFATAGSCFAQHIGRHLRARNLTFLDYEKPPHFLNPTQASALGYGVYSCRYGNIYTARQLWQLFQEAFDLRHPQQAIWRNHARYYDALRPGVQENGFGAEAEVRALRKAHLKAVRALFTDLDIFVFTLGLTEAWVDTRDGTVFPIAPGVIAGTFAPEIHQFHNFRYPEIMEDLSNLLDALAIINPKARVVLTVSPVPLAATATKDHVLVASTHSKATLRAVAGDIANDRKNVVYFPAYEVITGHPARHQFYKDDHRSILSEGVDEVARHFFGAPPAPKNLSSTEAPARTSENIDDTTGYEHCEESLLDRSEK